MWRNIPELPVLAVIPESKIHQGRGEKKVKRTSGIWDIITPLPEKRQTKEGRRAWQTRVCSSGGYTG
ncbi:MAG: hypothetical protein ACLR8P_14645 [Clostridium fessum]